jgi:hypothetical protein
VTLDGRDRERLGEELDRLRRFIGSTQAIQAAPACPYPGMVPFTSADETRFFGRAPEVATITARLEAGASLIVVIGPSGCGKSSLLSAGVLPRLRASGWPVLEMRASAAATFDLDEAAARAPTGQRVLLMIDQFEEVFTWLAENRDEASPIASPAGLVENLFVAIGKARTDARCAVVLALRADFFGDLMGAPLWPVIPEQRVEIGSLAGDRLREAIRLPANLTTGGTALRRFYR